jgi:hypothetical protein
LVLLVLNDHWGKQAFPGWWTGKLSDVAGLCFFPLLLQGLLEWLGWVNVASRRVLIGCVVATGLVFAGVKTCPWMAELYRWGLGLLQWPVWALRGLPLRQVELHMDGTDLIALPALGLAFWVGARRVRLYSSGE